MTSVNKVNVNPNTIPLQPSAGQAKVGRGQAPAVPGDVFQQVAPGPGGMRVVQTDRGLTVDIGSAAGYVEAFLKANPHLADKLGAVVSSATANIGSGQVMSADLQSRWAGFVSEAALTGGMDINAFVQWVLRDSYLEVSQDLLFFAQKVKFFNEVKKKIRDEANRARKWMADNYAGKQAEDGKPVKGPVFNAVEINKNPDAAGNITTSSSSLSAATSSAQDAGKLGAQTSSVQAELPVYKTALASQVELRTRGEIEDKHAELVKIYEADKLRMTQTEKTSYNAAIRVLAEQMRQFEAQDKAMGVAEDVTQEQKRNQVVTTFVKVEPYELKDSVKGGADAHEEAGKKFDAWIDKSIKDFEAMPLDAQYKVIDASKKDGVTISLWMSNEEERKTFKINATMPADFATELRKELTARKTALVGRVGQGTLMTIGSSLVEGIFGAQKTFTAKLELAGPSLASGGVSVTSSSATATVGNGRNAASKSSSASSTIGDRGFTVEKPVVIGGGAELGGVDSTTSSAQDTTPGVIDTKDELEAYIKKVEEDLNSVGDDAQLANVDLQNVLQKQQQVIQMMSNISKMLHDTAMSIIRKIGG